MSLTPENIAILCLIIVLVLDRILGMLKTRGIDLQLMARQTDDLWKWHNKEDDEGVKIWYVRRSLEDAIKDLATTIATLASILQAIQSSNEVMMKSLSSIEVKIDSNAGLPRNPK